MNLKPLDNLVMEAGDIRLRELRDVDYGRILGIVRAYSARATLHLYMAYRQEPNLEQTMLSIDQKDFLKNLLKNFRSFDEQMDKEHIKPGMSNYNEFLVKIEDALKLCPDDVLFSPYGPITAPFDTSVKTYIERAKEARKVNNRKVFCMGIEIGSELAGCFAFDFIKEKAPDNQGETTGDFGIFIDPAFRGSDRKRLWTEVFSLASVFIEQYYPFPKKEIPIRVTTHRLNQETGNILSPQRGFKEFKQLIMHKKYGERRFFTILLEDFIKNFRMSGKSHEVRIFNILIDETQTACAVY